MHAQTDPAMGPRDSERYKRLLLAKLEELLATKTGAESPVAAAGGLEGDLIDQANADAEAELQVRLHQSDARLLRAIEEALARITRGTFGMWENCRQPISKARLEAVPWTRLCRDCKEHQQANPSKPLRGDGDVSQNSSYLIGCSP